jgi:hypothetical protein
VGHAGHLDRPGLRGRPFDRDISITPVGQLGHPGHVSHIGKTGSLASWRDQDSAIREVCSRPMQNQTIPLFRSRCQRPNRRT